MVAATTSCIPIAIKDGTVKTPLSAALYSEMEARIKGSPAVCVGSRPTRKRGQSPPRVSLARAMSASVEWKPKPRERRRQLVEARSRGESAQPPRRDGREAVPRSQEAAGDRPGGVGVAAPVDHRDEHVLEGPRLADRPHGHPESAEHVAGGV
jgi:hypothetical protein